MGNWLRVLAGPIIGGLLAAGARWLGIELTEDQQASAADVILTGITVGGALVGSKLVASKVNPGNAASPTMAKEFKAQRDEIKYRESQALPIAHGPDLSGPPRKAGTVPQNAPHIPGDGRVL